jgi:hypothetical protein
MANFTSIPCVVDVTITDNNGTPANPTTLTAYLRNPSDAETVYVFGASGTWTNLSTGVFTFSFTPTVAGLHLVGFTGEHANWRAVVEVGVEITTLRPFD